MLYTAMRHGYRDKMKTQLSRHNCCVSIKFNERQMRVWVLDLRISYIVWIQANHIDHPSYCKPLLTSLKQSDSWDVWKLRNKTFICSDALENYYYSLSSEMHSALYTISFIKSQTELKYEPLFQVFLSFVYGSIQVLHQQMFPHVGPPSPYVSKINRGLDPPPL